MRKISAASQIKMALSFFSISDPAVSELALERLNTGRQLFCHRTHRLRPEYRDRDQAYLVLWAAKTLAEHSPIPIHFTKDEQKLMNRRSSRKAKNGARPASDLFENFSSLAKCSVSAR